MTRTDVLNRTALTTEFVGATTEATFSFEVASEPHWFDVKVTTGATGDGAVRYAESVALRLWARLEERGALVSRAQGIWRCYTLVDTVKGATLTVTARKGQHDTTGQTGSTEN